MANVPFINPKGGYLSIRKGTTQYDIPCLPQTGIHVPDNNRLLTAASAGQAGIGASNMVTGIKTPTLSVSTMAMPSFFTAAFLSDLLLTRDAQGDLSMLDFKYCQGTGMAAVTDMGKLSTMRIGIDRGSNFISLDMQFLCLNQASGATFAAYDHPEGVPDLACAFDPSFTPSDGTTDGTNYVVYGSTGENITLSTGAYGRKFSGGAEACDQLTHIAAPVLAGAVTVDQQAGAQSRLDASASGLFLWQMTNGAGAGIFTLTLGVSRVDRTNPLNPGGEADVITSWQLYSGGNAAHVLMSAA